MVTKEQRIEQHRAAIVSELEDLRQATAKYTFIDKNGTLKVRECEELANIQSRIKEREQALDVLDKSVHRILAALKVANVDSIEALQEKRHELEGIIAGAPYRAWEKFRMLKELPVTSGGFPTLLPGELAQVDSYKEFEKGVKAERDQAQKELSSISSSVEECSRLSVVASTA
jgi:hypothetical protein